MTEIRLHKYLALCGIGSRRKCERYIEEGRIKVDNKIIRDQGVKIDPDVSEIIFDGKIVKIQQKCWVMINKPPKYICSSNDPGNRPSFLDLIPSNLGRLYTVGRLDYMSEGLLIVTNDGDLAYKISHPSFEVKKVYEVYTVERLTDNDLKKMENGIKIDKERLRLLEIKEKKIKGKHFCYIITIAEGRYRHLRRMFAALNIHLIKLKRIRIGPLKLGDLKRGEWRFLNDDEIDKLKNIM